MTPKQAEQVIKLLKQIERDLTGILLFTAGTLWTVAAILLFRS